MTIKVELLTSHDTFTRLHELADGHGSVKVDRELLSMLLIDHSVMTRALRDNGLARVAEPLPKRVRARIG